MAMLCLAAYFPLDQEIESQSVPEEAGGGVRLRQSQATGLGDPSGPTILNSASRRSDDVWKKQVFESGVTVRLSAEIVASVANGAGVGQTL